MNLLLVLLLLQSLPLPPRYAMENPAAVSAVPKKLKNDYDKLWARCRGNTTLYRAECKGPWRGLEDSSREFATQ